MTINTAVRETSRKEGINFNPLAMLGYCQGTWAKQVRAQSVEPQPILKIFFTGRHPGKFAVNWLLKISPVLACVASLQHYLCEMLALLAGVYTINVLQGAKGQPLGPKVTLAN